MPEPKAAGLKDHGYAKTGKVTCQYCKLAILKDAFRWQYRVKVSRTFSSLVWLHHDCLQKLPPSTRDVDLLYAKHAVRVAVPESKIRELLQEGQLGLEALLG